MNTSEGFQGSFKQEAKKIAEQLNENNPHAIRLIRELLDYMGLDFVLNALGTTLEIEKNGGMMISSGTRKRTPGGIFFKIVEQQLTPEQRAEIFREEEN